MVGTGVAAGATTSRGGRHLPESLMQPSSGETHSEGTVTRLLLTLIAIGASLMLLSGAMPPVADGDVPPLGIDVLAASIERVKELLGV